MNKITNLPRFYGPLATVAFTVAYHAGSLVFGYPPNAVWVTVFVVWGTFSSGLRGGLAAALWAAAWAFYTFSPEWAAQLALGLPLIAVVVGWQARSLRRSLSEAERARLHAQAQEIVTRAALDRASKNEAAAQAINALNGNIYRIRHSRDLLLKMLENHPLDDSTREEIRQVLHVLNNLEQATAGWQQLAAIKERLDRE